jgi:hypothetical protein
MSGEKRKEDEEEEKEGEKKPRRRRAVEPLEHPANAMGPADMTALIDEVMKDLSAAMANSLGRASSGMNREIVEVVQAELRGYPAAEMADDASLNLVLDEVMKDLGKITISGCRSLGMAASTCRRMRTLALAPERWAAVDVGAVAQSDPKVSPTRIASWFLHGPYASNCCRFTSWGIEPGVALALVAMMPQLRMLELPLRDWYTIPAAASGRSAFSRLPGYGIPVSGREDVSVPLHAVMRILSELRNLEELHLLAGRSRDPTNVPGGLVYRSLTRLNCDDSQMIANLIPGCPKLRNLDIMVRRSDSDLDIMVRRSDSEARFALDLDTCPDIEVVKIIAFDPVVLRARAPLVNLRGLRIWCPRPTTANFASLAPNLRRLDLTCQLRPAGLAGLAGLRNVSELSIRLRGAMEPELRGEYAAALAAIGNARGAAPLSRLTLENFECDPAGLFGSPRCSELRYLCADSCEFGKEAAASLAGNNRGHEWKMCCITPNSSMIGFVSELLRLSPSLTELEIVAAGTEDIATILETRGSGVTILRLRLGTTATSATVGVSVLRKSFPSLQVFVLDAPKKALAPLAVWIEVQCSGYVSRYKNVGLEAGIRVLEANVPLSEIATGYREAFADKFRALMSDIWVLSAFNASTRVQLTLSFTDSLERVAAVETQRSDVWDF